MRSLQVWMTVVSLLALSAPSALAQGPSVAQVVTEPLADAPLLPLPSSMSFEEYEDMNRGLLKAMPYGLFPGGIHFYAKEDTTGWILGGTVALGVVLVIAGASMMEEGQEWQETPHETVDLGDQRFARVPKSQELSLSGTTTHYTLERLEKEQVGGGGALLGLGVAAIVGSYIYDIFHGMRVIEEKRNRVRFKYGQQLQTSMGIDPTTGEPRVTMRLRF